MTSAISDPTHLRVCPLGGPTVILDIAGLRLLTDPTFDGPGAYDLGRGYSLTKTAGPALGPDDIGPIDVVLLSHDQHPDNLDTRGRAFLARVPRIVTTVSGAARLGDHATALPRWAHVEVPRPDGGVLRVTGVPAQHGPDGTDHLTGEVTGFVLSGEGLPTVYVSGDNASLAVVRAIVDRLGRMDSAILFAGAAQTPLLGEAHLTLTGRGAADAAQILGARRVAPAHVDSWTHFSEGADALRQAFADAGIADRLVLVEPGATAVL
jgi:L-ascorbate metabolism protein UlaG (beta-lactamase superfamily)